MSCHAWGYHHPAAIRLPTDKPTTTKPTTTTTTTTTTSTVPPSIFTDPATISTTIITTSENIETTYLSVSVSTTSLPTTLCNDTNHETFSPSPTNASTTFPTSTSKIEVSSTTPTTSHITGRTEPTTSVTTLITSESTTFTDAAVTESVRMTSLAPSKKSVKNATVEPSLPAPKAAELSPAESVGNSSVSPISVAVTQETSTDVTTTSGSLVLPILSRFALGKNVSSSDNASATQTCLRNESEVSYWDFGYCGVNCTGEKDCNTQQNEKCICDGPCGMSCLSPDLGMLLEFIVFILSCHLFVRVMSRIV